jgi:hypothetical protein
MARSRPRWCILNQSELRLSPFIIREAWGFSKRLVEIGGEGVNAPIEPLSAIDFVDAIIAAHIRLRPRN